MQRIFTAADQNNNCNNPTGVNNQFIGLSKGIGYTFTYNSNSYRVFIRENEFTNNSIGIDGTGGAYAQIYKNEFKLNANFIHDNWSTNPKGINTHFSQGYKILNNYFEWNNNDNPIHMGIWSEEDGYDNLSLISQNTFRNISNIRIVGDFITSNCPQANINLQIICNTYKDNSVNLDYDWLIDIINCDNQYFKLIDQYSEYSGGNYKGAGNIFSLPMTCKQGKFNIYNLAPPFVYYTTVANQPTCTDGMVINNLPTQENCTTTDLCDIYQPQPGHNILEMLENNYGTDKIFELIYSKSFDSARILINKINKETISKQNLNYLLKTILSIYENKRDYSKMNENEKSILSNLTKYDDYAANISKRILEFFDQQHFHDKPIRNLKFEPKISFPENLKSENFANRLDVYPNPAKNYFYLDYSIAENQGSASILIYDLIGKKVKEIPVKNNNGNLKIVKEDLGASSFYNCILSIDGKEIIHKAIVITE